MTSRRLNRLLNYENMKNYKKQQYTGNENGWAEPIKTLGVTSIHAHHAAELNAQFRNTGIKYVETDMTPIEWAKKQAPTTTNEADHGEPGMVVKDGKFQKTDNKTADKMKELGKDAKADKATSQQPAKPTDKDAFVESDGKVKHAEVDKLKSDVKGAPNNPA
jgi:hypothetical protein